MNAGAIVIVGAGQAGGWAAATLRDRGYSGRVVLLGDEPHASGYPVTPICTLSLIHI